MTSVAAEFYSFVSKAFSSGSDESTEDTASIENSLASFLDRWDQQSSSAQLANATAIKDALTGVIPVELSKDISGALLTVFPPSVGLTTRQRRAISREVRDLRQRWHRLSSDQKLSVSSKFQELTNNIANRRISDGQKLSVNTLVV